MEPPAQLATGKPRVAWPDALRVLAAFAIVMVHVAMDVVAKAKDQNSLDWWVGNIADSGCRWAAPVFVMISGAFLLAGSRQESLATFWKKRLNRILIPLAFWSLLYGVLSVTIAGVSIKEMVTLTLVFGRPAAHLWYLYMTLGLYLFTPFLRTYIGSSSSRERRQVTLLMLGLASLHSFFAVYFFDYKPVSLMLFVPYLGYYLCGHELREVEPGKLPVGRLGLLFIGSVLVTAAGTGILTAHFGRTAVESAFFRNLLSPTVIVMTISAFLLGIGLVGRVGAAAQRVAGIFTRMAPTTLGIYVLHPLVASGFKKAFGLTPLSFSPLWSIPILSVATFCVSYLVIAAMLKVPYLRRTVS
jgi:surface polysaccharide O-acyltransferase-like enzyme